MILPCSPPFILQVPFTTITVGIDISRFGIPDLSKVPVSSTSTWPGLAKAFQTGHFPTQSLIDYNNQNQSKSIIIIIIIKNLWKSDIRLAQHDQEIGGKAQLSQRSHGLER